MRILNLVDPKKLSGRWSCSMLLVRADTLRAANRTDDAIQTLREVLVSRSATDRQKQTAREAIQSIGSPPKSVDRWRRD
jgi:hypothetical protein